MDKKELVSKLTTVFRRVFNNELLELTDHLSASDVENWDSLTHMALIAEVENDFSIKFKFKDLNKMRNVGDMIRIIGSKI
ncbi:acyl carrier protein [Saccharicrinis sp. GN24d3]|uniref:acyl carrier protein n=1 Tax=Saccharicrinis sp. GN24d3 TaxID=3458416 RepID=UPI00403671A9